MTANRVCTEQELQTIQANDPVQILKYLRLKVIDCNGPINPLSPNPLSYINGEREAYRNLYDKMVAGYFAAPTKPREKCQEPSYSSAIPTSAPLKE
jgi:hypothetical protein